MSKPKIAGYGSWRSPITARQIAEGSIRLCDVMLADGCVFWVELRPTEGGRSVIVRRDARGRMIDMTPEGFNARTRVHEYGGGAYLPCDGEVTFTNFADQWLYRCDGQAAPKPVMQDGNIRYADFACDCRRERAIAVAEDHHGDGEPTNNITAINLRRRSKSKVLVEGNDFYAAPRISPDGGQLAWLTWNHPMMPWDSAELWVAPVNDDGSIGEASHIAGGADEAIAQPEWSPDGVLHFVSDRTDWWNIYRLAGGQVEAVTQLDAEFARPHWQFRMSCYGFDGGGRIVCTYVQNGQWKLAAIDVATGELSPIETPYNSIAYLQVDGGKAAFVGGSVHSASAVVLMDLKTGEMNELRRASQEVIDPGYLSAPEAIEFPTDSDLTAHGLFYPPRNKDFVGPGYDKPPLVVMVHGGPTAATTAALKMRVQYYTSRGIAVLDVDYGGSTGYGRKYRRRLYGQWGLVDVADCCNGAKYLADAGKVNPKRMAITGGSAGGYTTLAALVFRDVFAAGASHYGVSNCELLAVETHKFEARYLDCLIGPYPERRDLYIHRSPIHHVDGLSCPVAFFQGAEDRVVPPDQARSMADALRRKGLPVAHVEFPGEQHGFRKAENIRRAMEGELYFFSQVFGFELAGSVEPIEIENL